MKGCFSAILALFAFLCLLVFAGLFVGGLITIFVYHLRAPIQVLVSGRAVVSFGPLFLMLLIGIVFSAALLSSVLSRAVRASRSSARRDLPECSRQIQSLEEMRAGIKKMADRLESLETILSASRR